VRDGSARHFAFEGSGLRLLRVRRRLSQAALADAVGIAQSTLSDYERGKRRIKPDAAAHLMAVLLGERGGSGGDR
jgi:transcriptional regulator with XRE-family HTH domain